MTADDPSARELLMCARCLVNVRAHQWMGCLCPDCEDVIDGMSQAQVDADYATVMAARQPIKEQR